MANFNVLCPNGELIQRLIPHYAEMVDLMVECLAGDGREPAHVLDLGAGRISEVLHYRYPDAQLTLLDVGEEVLDIARDRLSSISPRFIVGDFTCADLGHGYDAIVAGLTLHHLDDAGKRALMPRLWDALSPGGLLVISDLIRGETPTWDKYYEQMWLEHISSVPAQQHENVLRHYRDHDRPSTLQDQLHWLQEAGFTEVACHWRYLNFALFSGIKPG